MASPAPNNHSLILIVDDSNTMRATVRSILEAAGYEVTEAKDGVQGLEVLEKLSLQGRGPAMIISDVNMPRLDGLSFIKEVKKTAHKFLPILVLTTESEPHLKLAGRQAGASGWLVKPFKPETLVAVVNKYTRSPN